MGREESFGCLPGKADQGEFQGETHPVRVSVARAPGGAILGLGSRVSRERILLLLASSYQHFEGHEQTGEQELVRNFSHRLCIVYLARIGLSLLQIYSEAL